MTPVLIPFSGGQCVGMYGAASGPIVLMCPPIGDEGRKTARLWHDLASDLSKRGIASLRFDLPGTGNSAGEPTDPDIVDAWRAAVRACAEWAASRHGGRLTLLGYRFGALLALDASSDVTVERLVLLDPPVSGVATARYIRARARLENAGSPPEGPAFVQTGELLLHDSALAAIASLPRSIDAAQIPAALIVLPQTVNSSPWPARLARAGCAVETMPFHGYDDFALANPFTAKPPTAVIEHVVHYLARGAQPCQALDVGELPISPRLDLGDCSETPIRFGDGRDLFGIMCCPDTVQSGSTAVLLPTTGVDPCHGMSRMWTDLARRLARHGVPSLRFDMGGVGESPGSLRPSALVSMYRADRFTDLQSALDALQARGLDRVIVVGYCSGAYAAWHTALADERICGIVAGNLLYLNDEPTLVEEALHLKPGNSSIGLRQGRLRSVLPRNSIAALRRLDEQARRVVPRPLRRLLRAWGSEPKETRRHVRALSIRGCAVTMVMAQHDHGHLRLQLAFGDVPRLPNGIALKVIEGADHLFSDRWHRATFLDYAAAFVLDRGADRPPVAPPPQSHRVLERAS